MSIKRSVKKKVVIRLVFFILILVLSMPSLALAKGGKTKNSQHGRGDVLRGLLDRVQKAGVPVVIGKKQRVKAARKHRNQIKSIGKKISGINHSMKPKK